MEDNTNEQVPETVLKFESEPISKHDRALLGILNDNVLALIEVGRKTMETEFGRQMCDVYLEKSLKDYNTIMETIQRWYDEKIAKDYWIGDLTKEDIGLMYGVDEITVNSIKKCIRNSKSENN